MNNLESIVTNFELSKKLKDAGFRQDSLFYYMVPKNDTNTYWALRRKDFLEGLSECYFYISAPTCEELLRELPDYIDYGDILYFPEIRFERECNDTDLEKITFSFNYFSKDDKNCLYPYTNLSGSKLVDTLAEMYLFLKVNKFIFKSE